MSVSKIADDLMPQREVLDGFELLPGRDGLAQVAERVFAQPLLPFDPQLPVLRPLSLGRLAHLLDEPQRLGTIRALGLGDRFLGFLLVPGGGSGLTAGDQHHTEDIEWTTET